MELLIHKYYYMNTNKISLFLMLLIACSACESPADHRPSSQFFTLSASMDSFGSDATRTVPEESTDRTKIVMQWGWYEEIGCFADTYDNLCFTFVNETESSVSTADFISDEADAIPAYAYYPYVEGASDKTAIPFTLFPEATYQYFDESSVSGYDIKIANNIEDHGSNSCGVVFEHMMALLRINIGLDGLYDLADGEELVSLALQCDAFPLSGDFTLDLVNRKLTRLPYDYNEPLNIELVEQPSAYDAYTVYMPVAPMKLSDYAGDPDLYRWTFEITTTHHYVFFFADILSNLNIEAGKCYDVPLTAEAMMARGYYYDEDENRIVGAYIEELEPDEDDWGDAGDEDDM